MSNIWLEVKNLSKRLGPNQALDQVSLEFSPARLHGLIGPDGAGKTTLLRTLVGLFHPDQGSVIYWKGNQSVTFSDLKPEMAYMPQQQSLYPDLSCREHLEFFRDLYQIAGPVYRQRKEKLLHLTRLEKFQDRPAGKLSGGMYKKLGLMCALMQSPAVILLDEPTNGVDPISRREFWDLLYGLVGEKVLVIIATSYMDEAERCGRVHVLDSGQVMASGEPQVVLEKHRVKSFEQLFFLNQRKQEKAHAKNDPLRR